MICPYCANDKSRVVATIKSFTNERFRKCLKCGKSFRTIEKVKIKDNELVEYEKILNDDLKV